MNQRRLPVFATLPLAVVIAVTSPAQTPTSPDTQALLEQLPGRIVPNVGQWPTPERFRMQVAGMQLFLQADGWSFWLHDSPPASATAGSAPNRDPMRALAVAEARAVALRMSFVGGAAAAMTPEQPLAGATNYLQGQETHATDVTGYRSVLYHSMYLGIDVRVREAAGRCEYDLLLAPGADLARVRVQVQGAQQLSIDADGALVMHTALGDVRQPRPTTWMVAADGSHRPLACDYRLLAADSFGLVAPDRDPALPLVVDPPLLYSTYVGGSGLEEPWQAVEGASGRIYICGSTTSFNFPTTAGVVHSAQLSTTDGFVACFDPSLPPGSQLVFATYIGGTADDVAFGIAVTAGGQIAITGRTASGNLPVTAGAFQSIKAAGDDGFVGLLAANATAWLGLSYFGGSSFDEATSVALTPNGDLLVTGTTQSTNLPTTGNAFDASHNGGAIGYDGFVARFDAAVSAQLYGTFVGGSGDEWMFGWDVDAGGVLTLVSGTSSVNMPVTPGAFDPTHSGGGVSWVSAEAWVARLDPSLPPAQQLRYATFFGGNGNDWPYIARSLPSGEIVLSGTTTSTNLPTSPGAYQNTFRGGASASNGTIGDAFVARLDPNQVGAAALAMGTYFGGTGSDQGLDFAVDTNGDITLVGWTQLGANLPTTPDAMRRTYSGNDGYIARLSGNGRQLLYSSLFGGGGNDGAWFVLRHADGTPTICGQTFSSNLPTQNAAQPLYGGGGDAWLARLQLLPTNTMRRGSPTSGSNGQPTIHARGDAVAGNAQFGLACSRAPQNRLGLLAFALLPAPGIPLLGIGLWVDPLSLVLSATVTSDGAGENVFALPLPAGTLPTIHVQYVWIEDPTLLTLSASDAMQIW